MEAIFDYTPQNNGDIILHVGDKIQRIKDVGCGWAIGHNITTGETGHFPADYVQPMTGWRKSFSYGRSKKREGISTAVQYSTKSDKTQHQEKGEEKISKMEKSGDPEKSPTVGKKWNKKLFMSMGKNKKLKALFGVIFGIILGTAIFLAMFYSFKHGIIVSSIITAVSTLILCTGLALSTRFRCIVMLTFPSLATGKGRATLLSVTTGLLLLGPVTNITYNSNQVAVSMACITELAYNQSQALQDKLEEPIDALRNQIRRGVEEVKSYAETVDKAFKTIEEGVKVAENTIKSALNAVGDFKQRCERSVNSGFDKCQSDAKKIKDECMKTLDPISMGAENVVSQVNSGVKTFTRSVSRLFGKKRRRRSCTIGECPVLLKRKKRGALGEVCNVFSVGDSICGGFKQLGICNIVALPQDLASGLFGGLKYVIDAYNSLFEVGVKSSSSIDNAANSSQSASQIINIIKNDLKEKLDMATYFISILTRIMSVSVILLILNAYLYERRYRSKLSFDNFYITSFFKEMDNKMRAQGKKSILPLKKKERKIYTDSRSIKMSPSEVAKCKIGLVQVMLHCVIAIMVILFDFLLYYILFLLKTHGDVRLTFTGNSNLNIEITGSGIMAQLFKFLANDIMISQTYNSTVDIKVCLPNPQAADISQIYILISLYLFALFCVIMQGYGQRLLHFIAAYFYPVREQVRINHLYRKILVKRKTFIQEAKQFILSNNANNTNEGEKLSACGNFIYRCRNMFSKKGTKQACKNCEEMSEVIVMCKNSDCTAVYCEECYTELGNNCPLCSGVVDNDIDGVIALDTQDAKRVEP